MSPATSLGYLASGRADVRPRRGKPPLRLYVAACLAMVTGLTIAAVLIWSSIVSPRPVWEIALLYLQVVILVLAPVFLMMGKKWAYAATISSTVGMTVYVAGIVAMSSVLLLPLVGALIVVLVALVCSPLWVAGLILLSAPVERAFEAAKTGRISVYLNSAGKEDGVVDPKEFPPVRMKWVYVPVTWPAWQYPWAGTPWAGHWAGGQWTPGHWMSAPAYGGPAPGSGTGGSARVPGDAAPRP